MKSSLAKPLIFFLDFDNTLFDARGTFWNDYKKFFAKFGVAPKICDETYHEIKAAHLKYRIDHHLRAINRRLPTPLPLDDVHCEFANSFPNLSQYLFSDVVPFLKRLKAIGATTIIVSHGDPDWQEYKVNATGLIPYIDERLYSNEHGDKYTFILPRAKGYARAIFVDDDARELDPLIAKMPEVERYLMDRRDNEQSTTHQYITTLAAISLDTS